MTNDTHTLVQALISLGKEESVLTELIDSLNDRLQIAYTKLRKLRKTQDEIAVAILEVLKKKEEAA